MQGLKDISHVCVHVSDMQESVKFYRDALGLKPIESLITEHFYALDAGNIILGIEPGGVKNPQGKPKTENPVLLQFKAESLEHLEQINQFLESRGVKLVDRSKKRSYGYITNFYDPDGNKLEVLFQ